MRSKASKNLTFVFSALLLVAFISLVLMGPTHALGMQSGEGGQQVGCIFDGMSEICAMSALAHIGAWQSLFTSVPATVLNALLAFLLLAISVFFVFRDLLFSKPRVPFRRFCYSIFDFKESRHKLMLWLSRFEHSPSFSLIPARI